MPGSSITAIRDGLVANLTTYLGPSVQVLPNPLADPTPPCLYVTRERSEYGAGGRGTDLHVFRVQALVALGSDIEAQPLLDEFLQPGGPMSVKDALEVVDQPPHVTLGGIVEDLVVTKVGPDTIFVRQVGTVLVEFLGFDITVDVYAPHF